MLARMSEPSPALEGYRAPAREEVPQEAREEGGGRPSGRWRWAAAAIALLQLALSLHAAWRVGPTYDEHYYATAGVAYWREGRWSFNREHPPLAKLAIGLPLALRSDLVWDEHALDRVSPPVRFFFQDNADELDRNLFLARLPVVLLTILCSLAIGGIAARRLGPVPGVVAQAAFAFCPNVLAQGSLAALDGPLMVAFFAAVWAFVRFLERPGPGRALVGGAAFGAAVLCKFTSLVLVPAFALLAALVALVRRERAPLVGTAAVFLVGLSTFWGAYGFEARSANEAVADPLLATASPDGGGSETRDSVGRIFTQELLAAPLRRLFGDERPIPLLTALKGLDYQLEATGVGHKSAYLGRPVIAGDFRDGNPHPEYYLVLLAIKNALPWTLLVLAGGVLLARDRGFSLEARLALLTAPLAVLALFATGNALMGVRYVLPVFPFFALWTASAARRFPRASLALVALATLSTLRVHPHYLMFYALPVGDRGPEISVVSDDWGQGVRAMGAFYRRNADALEAAGGLWYEPYSAADVRSLGLARARPLPAHPAAWVDGAPVVRGIVAVHALSYWRDVRPGTPRERRWAWLDAYEPFAVVDRSVYVYDTRAAPPGADPGWR